MELQYPSSLYKFYSFSMLSLKAMNNDSLWFAKPDSFNDPYDCAITAKIEKKEYIDAITAAMNSSSPKDELSKIWPGDKDVLEQCHKKMDTILKKIGICCFTEDPYDMGMWSHYGGQHKGFCVEYDCTEGTQLRALVKPVKYSDMRASVPRGIHVSVNDIDPDSFSESWLIKSTSWTQEKEWRVMKNDGGRLYKNLSNVKSIIFGARTLQDDIELMKKCMRHKQRIIFKKMSLVEDSFKLQMDTLRSDDSY